jgi:hypothetical protein
MQGHFPQNPLKIPVLIPDSRESGRGERFAQDCPHRQSVRPLALELGKRSNYSHNYRLFFKFVPLGGATCFSSESGLVERPIQIPQPPNSSYPS